MVVLGNWWTFSWKSQRFQGLFEICILYVNFTSNFHKILNEDSRSSEKVYFYPVHSQT